jgi:co-chaperonin GroES (HSP10)
MKASDKSSALGKVLPSKTKVKSALGRVLAAGDDAPAEDGIHADENIEMLKEAFNRFIDDEMKEKDQHDQDNLMQLKDSFAKFLDEEMGEQGEPGAEGADLEAPLEELPPEE